MSGKGYNLMRLNKYIKKSSIFAANKKKYYFLPFAPKVYCRRVNQSLKVDSIVLQEYILSG